MKKKESITAHISEGPLGGPPHRPDDPTCGAWVVFEGVVRETEDGRPLSALDYTAYEPMARDQLAELAESVLKTHGLTRLMVEHSRGEVPVGSCSFRLSIASGHRREALAAMGEFIDRMKKDVPIWKSPVWR
ncbi:MAG: molybdenum cofactor biosynthesis protein MoaE [Phycisphaerales bacterium]|nr:molybdenum cofactor biosynthesis protein MoaE [Phycisphaerales bacterium]